MARRRPRARVNWAVRWGGVGLLLLLAVLFAVSRYVRLYFDWSPDGRYSVYLAASKGRLWAITDLRPAGPPSPPRLRLGCWSYAQNGIDEGWVWRAHVLKPMGLASRTLLYADTSVPIPIVAAIDLAVMACALRSNARTRRLQDSCPSCHYDLAGLPLGSPCPECAATSPKY